MAKPSAAWVVLLSAISTSLFGAARASPVRVYQPAARVPLLARSVSEDPSCPPGFLCVRDACPSGVVCPTGEECVNFEGTLACAPPGRTWCALHPGSLEAVGCSPGGVCCHGNCYVGDAVCCTNPAVTCQVGELCNVCSQGQTCTTGGATTCLGGAGGSKPPPVSSTTSTTTTHPLPPVSTTHPLPPVSATTGTTARTASSVPVQSTTRPPVTSPPPTTVGSGSGSGTRTPPTTQTASTSSTDTDSQSASATATVVPHVGSFQDYGCWSDDPGSRALQGDSLQDDAMTVAKCVQFAADGAWRFASVEFGTQCFVGNTLRSTSVEPQSDCSKVCGGDAGELCGNGNRMQLYVDSTWFQPSQDQVVGALKEYNSSLAQVWDAIGQYQGALQAFQSDVASVCGGSSSRKRQSCVLTPALQASGVAIQGAVGGLSLVGGAIGSLGSGLGRLFKLGSYRDTSEESQPLISSSDLFEMQNMADTVTSALSDATTSGKSLAKTVGRALNSNTIPDIDIGQVLDKIQETVARLGTPGNIVKGVAAVGVCK
ncbi:hypothetical protein VTK73DRAFT_9873 [Phialemonium thermophilum]|uniref:WSC domain-containing protein n=1 Tax=Phialemonium thermophilum TaxID=223376 RepID=A0ABR3VZS6_9PEZI